MFDRWYAEILRKILLSTPKFLFFDLGVRHTAAGLTATPDVVKTNPGPFFEQWVGIELWKRLQYLGEGKVYHMRTKDGAEVDFIIERGGTLTPIKVKWSRKPSVQDARHLLNFIASLVQFTCPAPGLWDSATGKNSRLPQGKYGLPWLLRNDGSFGSEAARFL